MTRTRIADVTARRQIIRRRPTGEPTADPVALAVTVATAYAEVRTGHRPQQQLRGLVTHDAYRRIRATVVRHRGLRHAGGGTSVCRVVTCHPSDTAVEATVVMRHGRRILAVAVRCERRGDRWCVSDVGSPDDRAPQVSPAPRGTS